MDFYFFLPNEIIKYCDGVAIEWMLTNSNLKEVQIILLDVITHLLVIKFSF